MHTESWRRNSPCTASTIYEPSVRQLTVVHHPVALQRVDRLMGTGCNEKHPIGSEVLVSDFLKVPLRVCMHR
jgi:hypothetical protein